MVKGEFEMTLDEIIEILKDIEYNESIVDSERHENLLYAIKELEKLKGNSK